MSGKAAKKFRKLVRDDVKTVGNGVVWEYRKREKKAWWWVAIVAFFAAAELMVLIFSFFFPLHLVKF